MGNESEKYYAVIMAGGGGTRLWPLSRQSRPKQMIELVDNKPLFKIAVDRLDGLFPPERILVVTVADQAKLLQQICPQIPVNNYIIEPFPRGTASVVGLAAIVLQHLDKDATMAVLTADHFIENVDQFKQSLCSAYEASQSGLLVTLGIQPTFPSTGYGYIQRGEIIDQFQGMSVFTARSFREKPSLDLAQEFIEGGDHDWNSGMFIWQAQAILYEFERQMPELFAVLNEIKGLMINDDWNTQISDLWGKIVPQSIDYGIMEHAHNVGVIPVTGLGWNDVGAWDSLFEFLHADEHGNIIRHENFYSIETTNTMVFSEDSQRLIVSIGVEDLIVIDTGDALLLCKREHAQKVRQIVQILQKEKRVEYL